MPSDPVSPEFRSEFAWEKELRRDDERVRTYFSELPKFIDLPQEDAVILKRIQCREERIPHAIPLFQEKWDPERDPDPEEEREARDAWFRREGADIFLASIRLARGFAVLFAMDPKTARTPEFMSLLTLLGKISAKLADAVELAPDELPALRRALCKRIVADLNDAIGLQNYFLNNAGNEEAVSHLCSLGTQLRVIREDVLAMLFRARRGGEKGPNGG